MFSLASSLISLNFLSFFFLCSSFFSSDTATTEISTLSLHDALPISNNADRKGGHVLRSCDGRIWAIDNGLCFSSDLKLRTRSEEHTSELQSRGHLVCRLLLEKKKK